MLDIVRNDSRIHQAELKNKKKEEREEAKKRAIFPSLGTFLLVYFFSFSIALMSCTIKCPYASCRAKRYKYNKIVARFSF